MDEILERDELEDQCLNMTVVILKNILENILKASIFNPMHFNKSIEVFPTHSFL